MIKSMIRRACLIIISIFIIAAFVDAAKEYENINYVYENRVHTYSLSGSFGVNKYAYRRLVNTLLAARAGDRIDIHLRYHTGGVNVTREYITNAMLRSKAYITVYVHSFAGSNAALFFRYGNVAVIQKSSRIMFHQSFAIERMTGKRYYPAFLYRWSVREHNRIGAFAYMTAFERKKWYNRKDVYLSGKRICNSKFLLTNKKNSCIIKGIK